MHSAVTKQASAAAAQQEEWHTEIRPWHPLCGLLWKSKGMRSAALARDTEDAERKHARSYNVIGANSIVLPMICICLLRAGSTSQLLWSLQLEEQEQKPPNNLIPRNISHQANRTSVMHSWWDLLEP